MKRCTARASGFAESTLTICTYCEYRQYEYTQRIHMYAVVRLFFGAALTGRIRSNEQSAHKMPSILEV